MAVDTPNKRRAVTNFFLYVFPPEPDGLIAGPDRRQATGLYPVEFSKPLSCEIRGKYTIVARPSCEPVV